jgi:tetrahydromethanopterin S-methyltransferase subunit G
MEEGSMDYRLLELEKRVDEMEKKFRHQKLMKRIMYGVIILYIVVMGYIVSSALTGLL